MIPCRTARAHMFESAARAATDASRLEVESHIQDCAVCEGEYARWKLVGLVKQHAPARLTQAAERRILEHLVSAGAGTGVASPATVRRRSGVGTAIVSVVAFAAVALFVGNPFPALRAVSESAGEVGNDVVPEGQAVDALDPGTVSFAGAEVKYRAGTRMTLHPGGRTLSLAKGEVDVDVTPGLPGRFRVTTPKFIVEVLGTRFFVTLGYVRTVRGKVRVLDLEEHELAVVTAGNAWVVSDTQTVDAPLPEAAPSALSAPPVVPVSALSSPATPAARRPSVAELLARSRAALARGDAKQARGLAQRALVIDPTGGHVASAELLLADSLLVERRPAEAVLAYRRLVRRNPRAPEAETAQFAVGQLLLERGATVEASVALNDYVARYPMGRFVREAREHLALIRSKTTK